MRILAISGSPVGGSSTDILLKAVLDGVSSSGIKTQFVKLNDLKILPCQACGKSPEPDYCFFDDDMASLYRQMEKADAIILGSPLYFDSVSAQAKLFIDRTNCVRPLDFSSKEKTLFKKPRFKGKKGGMIIVGGEKFETALKTARAFFIWAGIDIVFEINYVSRGNDIGSAVQDESIIAEAQEAGKLLLRELSK